MANIRLNLTHVDSVHEGPNREITVLAVDKVRGPLAIHMDESSARWLGVEINPIIKAWRREDGEEESS